MKYIILLLIIIGILAVKAQCQIRPLMEIAPENLLHTVEYWAYKPSNGKTIKDYKVEESC